MSLSWWSETLLMTHLARTFWDCVIYHHSINSMLGCFVVLVQDPLLAFPFRYLGRFGAIPREARTLNPIKPAKKKDYLTLCQALLQTHPDESTRRSVEFLVQICSGTDPEPVPILNWLEGNVEPPRIQLGAPSALGRVAPLMLFRANLQP